jgi:hypothetical protein
MKKKLCVFVIMFATLVANILHSSSPPRVVSLDEAKNLVSATLPQRTRHLPKFAITGRDDPRFPQFYVLSATFEGPPKGSSVIGHYYVDKSTADVWDAVMECTELSTPALRKLQAKVRLRIGLSDSEYHKIRKKGPMCQ